MLTEHTIYAPMMSDFECSCGFEADDNNAVEVTPNEHVEDALIAAGLVTDMNEAGSEFGNDRLDGTVMTARDYRKSEAIALHEARGMVAVTRRIYATDWEPIEAPREAL